MFSSYFVLDREYEPYYYNFLIFCAFATPLLFVFIIRKLSFFYFGDSYEISLPFYNMDDLKSMSLTGVENDMIYKSNRTTIREITWRDVMNETYKSNYNWKTDASFFTHTYIYHLDNLQRYVIILEKFDKGLPGYSHIPQSDVISIFYEADESYKEIINIERLEAWNNSIGRKSNYPFKAHKECYLDSIEKYKYLRKKYFYLK